MVYNYKNQSTGFVQYNSCKNLLKSDARTGNSELQ